MFETAELFSVSKKRCLITGAATGIGAAIAEAFVTNGAMVAGTVRQSKPDWVTPSATEKWAGKFFPIPCDLDNQNDVTALPEKTVACLGGAVDVIIHAASPSLPHANRNTVDDMRANMRVGLESALILYESIAPEMAKQGGGSIISICSIWGAQAFPWNAGYTAVKSALCMYTKSVAFEYGASNVRANNILPGYTKTRANAPSHTNPEVAALRAGKTMLGRWALPSEMVGAALFLASNASSYVTGLDLFVDGGWTAKGG